MAYLELVCVSVHQLKQKHILGFILAYSPRIPIMFIQYTAVPYISLLMPYKAHKQSTML